MKSKAAAAAAAGFLKKMMAILANAKSITDLKSKLRELKTRFMIYSLLRRDKKVLFGSISNKIQGLLTHHQSNHQTEDQEEEEEESNLNLQQLVLYNSINPTLLPAIVEELEVIDRKTAQENEENNVISTKEDDDDDDGDEKKDKYPDLTYSLSEDDEHEMGRPGSVIDLMKKSKEARQQGDGKEFKLEDEIDAAADLFIKRFHRQMWIQKQNSLKERQPLTNTTN